MKTLAGTLVVEVNQSFIMMEQAKSQLGKIFDDYDSFLTFSKLIKAK